MSKVCVDCKWGVIGKYRQIYKGIPIGCNKPDDKRDKKIFDTVGVGGSCFEPKEGKND